MRQPALLCFAKAGQTHLTGEFKEVVAKGINFLVNNMKADGGFHEPRGTMYSHGIASQALITLYSSTEDKDLEKAAQGAINYIVFAQDPVGGGWRYAPKQQGDTSVSCWQLEALIIGQNAKLDVAKATLDGVTKFLDNVQSRGGSFYGYTTPGIGQATSAQGLLCRIRLGWAADDERVKTGVAAWSKRGPSKSNSYYNLFATQLIKEHGGKEWKSWRADLTQQLIAEQGDKDAIAGSWLSTNGDHGVSRGGRLYCTTMAILALESSLEAKKNRK
jgi:hypothetical protein